MTREGQQKFGNKQCQAHRSCNTDVSDIVREDFTCIDPRDWAVRETESDREDCDHCDSGAMGCIVG